MGFSYFYSAEFIRCLRLLERPKGNWNSRRLLERAKRIWTGLRPWTARRASGPPAGLLEQPQALGTRALALLERRLAATQARVCDGNAMRVRWACGDFELRCKITAFFWHGNGLSRMLWGLCPLTCTMLRKRSHLRRRSLSAGTPFFMVFLTIYDHSKVLLLVPRGKSFGFSLIFLWQICLL